MNGKLGRLRTMSAWWIVAALALTTGAWLVMLAGLLAVSNRLHDDIPVLLAVKLPLLALHPQLIFAGESRTEYQVDPGLVAELLGRPKGTAVNIAYDAGEPLAFLAAMRRYPEAFRNSHVAISVAPFLFNEGARSAGVYPLDVIPRLGVFGQMVTFLPLRVGMLIRFIREAFASRLAFDQRTAETAPQPDNLGLAFLDHTQSEKQGPSHIGSHPHYAGWKLTGPKAFLEIGALCDMTTLARKVTVVIPPWAPRYNRASDPDWKEKDDQYVALVTDAGYKCGFDVVNIPLVPDLKQDNYADEMHVNRSGVPKYTRYLMTQLAR